MSAISKGTSINYLKNDVKSLISCYLLYRPITRATSVDTSKKSIFLVSSTLDTIQAKGYLLNLFLLTNVRVSCFACQNFFLKETWMFSYTPNPIPSIDCCKFYGNCGTNSICFALSIVPALIRSRIFIFSIGVPDYLVCSKRLALISSFFHSKLSI